MKDFTFSGDPRVQARRALIEQMLKVVCDQDEFPWFVSDEATIHDVCTLTDHEIVSCLKTGFHVDLDPADLELPIWKIADKVGLP